MSMPAGLRRHLVGKTLRNVCHCDIAYIRFVGNLITDIFINQRTGFSLNNAINLRPPPNSAHCAVSYPQNGERIVATGTVTSLRPVYLSS